MRWNPVVLVGLGLASAVILFAPVVEAGDAVQGELKAIHDELRALRREVEEQGEMIRTLYEFADSQIDFEQKKKERQEEERLRLEPAVEIRDPNLTSLGCGSPVSAEIATITGDGGLRIYDTAGRITQYLMRRGETITALHIPRTDNCFW